MLKLVYYRVEFGIRWVVLDLVQEFSYWTMKVLHYKMVSPIR